MGMNNIITELANEQAAHMDNIIRSLCNTYWFEPENIRDTPYRIVIEETPVKCTEGWVKSTNTIYMTKVVNKQVIEFNWIIETND